MSDNFPLEAIQGMLNRLEDKIDERFSKIDDRLEKMDDKIDAVSKTTDKNTIVLEEHQRRALANEKHAHLLEEQIRIHAATQADAIKKSEEKQESKVKELADSVELFVKFPKHLYTIGKWLAGVSAVFSLLWAVFSFFSRYMAQ